MWPTKPQPARAAPSKAESSSSQPAKTEHGEKVKKGTTDSILLGSVRYDLEVKLDAHTRLPMTIVATPRASKHGLVHNPLDAVAVKMPHWEPGETMNLTHRLVLELPVHMRLVE